MSNEKNELTQLESMLELAPCGIALFEIETADMVFVNQAYCRMLGYTKEEYWKTHECSQQNNILLEDRAVKDMSADTFKKNGSACNYEYCVIGKEGAVIWLKMNASTVTIGNQKYAFVSFTNITKEKENYLKFKVIVDNMGSSVALFKVKKGMEELLYANDLFFELMGVKREEYQKNVHAFDETLVTKEEHDRIEQAIQLSYSTDRPQEVEHQYVRPTGEHLWLNRKYCVIEQDESDSYILLCIVTDLTDKKNKEINELLDKRRFKLVADEMNIAVFEWDANGENIYSSSALQNYAISQVDPNDIFNNCGPIELIHPDDRSIMEKFIAESSSGKERVDVTLRMKMIDGSFHWCHLIGFYYKDKNNRPSHTIGVIEDVNTEHERTFMLDNLLNELPGGVAIFRVSEKLECQYFSDGFAALSGRDRETVQKMLEDENLLIQGVPLENYNDFITHLRENKEVGRPLSFTYHFMMQNGEIGWLHVAAIKIKDEKGCPVYYCIYTNPTDETALYRSIVEDSAIGVFIADQRTRTNLYSNAALSKICGFDAKNIVGQSVEKIIGTYRKKELLTKEQIHELSFDHYSEFHVTRGGLYLAIKAKALKWNGVDSYILYIADETTEHARQIELQTMLASIPGGIAIYRVKKDGRTTVDYASEGFAKIFGFSVEECLAFPNINVCVIPEDLDVASNAVRNAIEKNQPIHAVYRVRTKSGEISLNSLDANVMTNAVLNEDDLAVLYSVQTKVSEESKRGMQEQKHYRQVLNMLDIAYWEWSKESGFYASSNYSKYALSNAAFEDVKESSVYDGIVHPDDIPLLIGFLKNGDTKQKKCSVIMRMLMNDGSYQWTEILGFREYDEDGEPIRISCTLRDMNEEWIKQKKALQAALEEAKKANEAKTVFLSRVSHDMRTPLNGILGLTTLLKDSVKNEQGIKDLSQLEISGQYLLNLINDTLDISRIENGKLDFHPSVCDGREAFENLMRLAGPTIEAKHITFEIHVENIPFTMLYIDLGRVEQIIMNIIGNAVKFTPENGKIEFTMEHLSTKDGVIKDRISIKDTGIGMSKEYLPHLFEAFSQADTSKTNARQGTGLGMAITKKLIDQMGGELTVTSELGKGSCFTFILPMQMASDEQIRDWKMTKNHEDEEALLKGKHVLLCEDHPLNQQIAARILHYKKMIVEIAENGKMGVEMFERSKEGYYDVILMDIRMPVMDGVEATRRIRALSRADASVVPIIAITGNSFDDEVKKTLEAGMNAHLSKPVDATKLFETIKEQLG